MSAEILELQTRVADDLTSKAGNFSITGWTAQTPFVPKFNLTDLATLKVLVCPASRSAETTSRQLKSRFLGIWVGVIKRLTEGNDEADDEAEIGTLIGFAEELQNLFVPLNSSPYVLTPYRATEVGANPLYDLDKLRNNREFRGSMLVTFRNDTA